MNENENKHQTIEMATRDTRHTDTHTLQSWYRGFLNALDIVNCFFFLLSFIDILWFMLAVVLVETIELKWSVEEKKEKEIESKGNVHGEVTSGTAERHNGPNYPYTNTKYIYYWIVVDVVDVVLVYFRVEKTIWLILNRKGEKERRKKRFRSSSMKYDLDF